MKYVGVGYMIDSHPTYEELKLLKLDEDVIIKQNSHPTYEELKLLMSLSHSQMKRNSHPTYEELKPSPTLRQVILTCQFTSYLWGIETKPMQTKYPDWKEIHILPMRNWNWPIASEFLCL